MHSQNNERNTHAISDNYSFSVFMKTGYNTQIPEKISLAHIYCEEDINVNFATAR